MTPTILIVGATGNTGRKLTETLPALLKKSEKLSSHRILGLTRSLKNDVAQKLAQIPGVEMKEFNWVEIDEKWLRDHQVERAFIASHNLPIHFAEESQFLVNCLRAGVKYVVRISTTADFVRPDSLPYYQRAHWAIEAMLSSPEFASLKWTSLQPQGFLPMFLWPAAALIKKHRETGKQEALSMMIPPSPPVPLIDSDDVGRVAAHLLAVDDVTPYAGKRLVLAGPEAISGEDIVKLVEKHIGEKIQEVKYGDMMIPRQLAEQNPQTKHLILSMAEGVLDELKTTTEYRPTSPEVMQLCPPRRTASEVLADLLSN